MNFKSYPKESLLIFTALLMMILSSCNPKGDSLPFPQEKSEFLPPSSQPLRFSEPQKIEWRVNDSMHFQPAIPVKVNLKNLSSKPFYPDGFIPVKAPMEETSIKFNTKYDTIINFKELTSNSINFSTSILEVPLLVKADLPKIKKNSAVGIFEFGEDQGLPGYLVSAMMEDSNGMLWIATDKGLCRFNGEYLEIYNFIDDVFTGGQATVTSMVEDKKGRIWIKTAGKGIYVLDLDAGVVRNVDFFRQALNLNTNCRMIMDSRGLIWLGTLRNGIYIIDPNDNTYIHAPQLKSEGNGNAEKLAEDFAGNIWVGSASGVSVLDFNTGKIQTLENQKEYSLVDVTGLFHDSENRIWVGTQEEGVSIIDVGTGKIRHLGPAQGITNSIHHFTEGNDKKIWMSSNSGVYILDPSKQTLKHLNESKGLSDEFVNSTYLDHEGQIWIATGSALNLMDTEGLMPNFLTAADGLSGPDAWSFFKDTHGQLWIGTRQGIDIYDPERKRIKKVDIELQLRKGAGISYKIEPLPSGDYLISAPGLGLAVFNPKQQTITTTTPAHGLNTFYPSSSLVDSSGRIWTGAFRNGAVENIDLKNNTFKVLTNKDGLIGNFVWGLFKDSLGQIWVSTDKGINIINVVENTVSHLMEDGKISERNGGDILQDAAQRLWIATRSGLLIVDQEKGLLTTILPENGLAHNAVYTLYQDKGKIYSGTENGLTVFSPNTTEISTEQFGFDIKSYGKEQGFIFNNYNAGAAVSFDDKMWWGIETQALTITNIPKDNTYNVETHISGITISDKPQNFYDNKTISQNYPELDTLYSAKKDTFYVSGKLPKETGWLKANDIQWDGVSGHFNLPENLKIPFEQNYVSFQFTGKQLTNRDKTRYSYFLEGFDTKWSEITNNSFSKNYRKLAAGKYTFKVRTRTFDGIWSQPAEFSFTILPHWTNTWWAWILYILAFMIVVGSIVRYRSRALQRENVILDEKVKHRTAQLNKSIENLKLSQAQLIQSEKMASLGELTAGIAHEIQNPLNFVNNFSEVNAELIDELIEEIDEGNFEEVKEIANNIKSNEEKIKHHGGRADSIVKGMLKHSRTNSSEKTPTNINAICDEYLRLAYHGLRAKDNTFNAKLESDFDESIGNINVVAQDISRVILNLITNAFQACETDAVVKVSTKKLKDHIEVIVEDNGSGIPDAIKEKIFQPFFTTKPTGQGTGLGLSLSYDIVKAHGGELTCSSKVNEGTKFIVKLPA